MTLPALIEGQATAPRSWRAPSQPLLTKIDLQGLVERGALSGLHMQSDGSLILDCPAGLPAELEGLVEETLPDLDSRLARLERDMDDLSDGLQERERLNDRLEAVEFGLAERLQNVIAEEVLNLFAEQQEGPSVVEKIESLLTSVRQTEAPDLLARIEARLPDPALIEARLEEIASRPVPQPDLTQMRQMNASFLQAMHQVMGRLEGAVDTIGAPHQLEALPAEFARLMQGFAPPAVDFSLLFDRLAQSLAPLEVAVGRLTDRVTALEDRPAPMLDLTEQRKSFAGYSTALSTTLRRVEALDAKLETVAPLHAEIGTLNAGLATLSAKIDALPSSLTLEQVLAKSADLDRALAPLHASLAALSVQITAPIDLSQVLTPLQVAVATLAERVAGLEGKPQPTLDLTEQRQSFADLTTALDAALRRIESVAQKWDVMADPLPDLTAKLDVLMAAQGGAKNDSLADAILTLAQRAADREAPPNLPGFEAFRAAQQDFFQDLRFLLAEIIATQMRQQALAS